METKEAEEKALNATSRAVTALQASGSPDTDPDLAQLLKRQERQQREVTRLTNKAPTFDLRKLALVEAKGAFKKQLRAEHDFADKGRIKAESRAQERHSWLKALERWAASSR